MSDEEKEVKFKLTHDQFDLLEDALVKFLYHTSNSEEDQAINDMLDQLDSVPWNER